MHNAISWFEIPASDFGRAVGFYSAVLGRELRTGSFMGVPHGFFPADEEGGGGAVVGNPDATTARLSADVPFQALSDNRYVYLFRQSIDGGHPDNIHAEGPGGAPVPVVDSTLLCDRFVLAETELMPKMEVRYQRSRSKHWPQSRKDSLGARDMTVSRPTTACRRCRAG